MLTINREHLNEQMQRGLTELSTKYPFAMNKSGIPVTSVLTKEQKLTVHMDNKGIVITHPTLAAFYRGFGHVLQNAATNMAVLDISEDIYFKTNGLMFDNSRNGVMTVERTKDYLLTLAILGENLYMPYMEDTYEMDEPFWGYMRGGYSADELKAIDDYAYDLGIEVVPCIETLGHLGAFLRWPASEKYRDTGDNLMVGSPDTLALIDKMFRTLAPCLRSKRIHVGLDEAYSLGRGKYLQEHGLQDKCHIMKQHVQDISRIAKKYDMSVLMWDDMFFHNRDAKDSTDIYSFKPDNVHLMFWNYYINDEEGYEESIVERQKMDKELLFAGGAWKWGSMIPHHSKTIKTTNAALNVCKRHGIQEVMCTAWGDDGCECPAGACLMGLTLFAEHQYHKEVDMDAFKDRVEFVTGIPMDSFMMMEEFDMLHNTDRVDTFSFTKSMFYQDPMAGSNDWACAQLAEKNPTVFFENLELYFAKQAYTEENSYIKLEYAFFQHLAGFMRYKWGIGIHLADAYKAQDKKELRRLITDEVQPAVKALYIFADTVYDVWMSNYKETGSEILDGRIGWLIERLRTTEKAVMRYVNGETDHLQMLDMPRVHSELQDYGHLGMITTNNI